MKVLVLSDSHGNVETMVRAVEREEPRMIFHLGDCWRDADALIERFPDTPLFRVPGNCDFRLKDPVEQLIALQGFRVLLCHGHTYGVKQGMWEAHEAAKQQNLDAFLFGHTHRPLVEKQGKTIFLNPGTAGLGHPCTYGLLTVENGKLDARVYKI